jgi:hypothetical protein
MCSRVDVRERSSDPAPALRATEPDWFTVALKPLREVNERLLDLLVFASEDPNEPRLPLAVELGDVLRRMDPTARERAAACPFLLVDAGFRNVRRWSRVRCGTESVDLCAGCFPRAQALELAHMTLVLAWSLVRSNRDAACIMLGVSPACAKIVADLHLKELQRIATQHTAWIRPAFENRPDVWRSLLGTADPVDSPPVAEVGLHGLQLFFGDLLSNEPA